MQGLDLQNLKQDASAEIEAAQTQNELDSVYKKYLDKEGFWANFSNL